MIRYTNIEITIGLFFILALSSLLFITVHTTHFNLKTQNGSYHLKASFEDINGLSSQAPVRIGGVKIGEIEKIELNPDNYLAEVSLIIFNKEIEIPDDSSISILTEGLLGTKFASITPGFSDKSLEDNDYIKKTYPAIVFERVLGQAIAYISSKQ